MSAAAAQPVNRWSLVLTVAPILLANGKPSTASDKGEIMIASVPLEVGRKAYPTTYNPHPIAEPTFLQDWIDTSTDRMYKVDLSTYNQFGNSHYYVSLNRFDFQRTLVLTLVEDNTKKQLQTWNFQCVGPLPNQDGIREKECEFTCGQDSTIKLLGRLTVPDKKGASKVGMGYIVFQPEALTQKGTAFHSVTTQFQLEQLQRQATVLQTRREKMKKEMDELEQEEERITKKQRTLQP